MPGIVGEHLSDLRFRRLSAATIDQRRLALGRLARFLDGTPLLEATAEQLADWRASIDWRIARGIATEVSHVRCFYAWGVERGLITVSPAVRLAVPRLGRLLPRPAAEDSLEVALAAAPPQIRVWLVLGAMCGLRAKEIALLRRDRVLDRAPKPCIVIAADATKGAKERVIPLDDVVLAELQPWLSRSGWLFPRADGQPGPNRPQRVSARCNIFLRKAGAGFTLHQLRHRFCTVAFAVSQNIRVVQGLAGHAKLETTAGYTAYANADAIATIHALPVPPSLRPAS